MEVNSTLLNLDSNQDVSEAVQSPSVSLLDDIPVLQHESAIVNSEVPNTDEQIRDDEMQSTSTEHFNLTDVNPVDQLLTFSGGKQTVQTSEQTEDEHAHTLLDGGEILLDENFEKSTEIVDVNCDERLQSMERDSTLLNLDSNHQDDSEAAQSQSVSLLDDIPVLQYETAIVNSELPKTDEQIRDDETQSTQHSSLVDGNPIDELMSSEVNPSLLADDQTQDPRSHGVLDLLSDDSENSRGLKDLQGMTKSSLILYNIC